MLEQHHDKVFSFLHNTSVWTIASGTAGGVYKSLSQNTIILDTVSMDGSFSVASYAFLSATVGYCTKRALDYLFKKLKKQ